MQGNYEFSPSQNELIQDLSKKMKFVGYILLALGILLALVGVFTLTQGGVGTIVQGVIQIVLGIWTGKAASAFQRIVDTSGSDIENLMGALGELRKLYNLQFWLFLIGLILIAIAFVIGFIAAAAGGLG